MSVTEADNTRQSPYRCFGILDGGIRCNLPLQKRTFESVQIAIVSSPEKPLDPTAKKAWHVSCIKEHV
jgi:hypothetical protein